MSDFTIKLDPQVLSEYLNASIKNSDNVLGRFAERFHQDPLGAFMAADEAAKAAARKHAAETVLRLQEEGLRDVQMLTAYATARVFENALESPRNVAPYQNLAETCTAAAWAELLKFTLDNDE